MLQRDLVIQEEKDLDIPSSCRLRVFVHGPLEVWKREGSSTWKPIEKDAWGKGRPARSVFKRLLVVPGRRLSRGAIQDDLWPNTENFELADKNVYNAINQIRRVAGKALVRTFDTSYELADQSVIWVDRDACEALLKEAENWGHTSQEALALLEQALAYLERGELLEGESETWVYGLRKKSEDMLRQCRLWLAQAYELQGKLWQAGEQYRAMILTNPSDEDAFQRWMTMLHQQGKTQEALKCYRDMKEFVEGQGFTPSNTLEQMVASLNKQPTLALISTIQIREERIEGKLESEKQLMDLLSRRNLFKGMLGIVSTTSLAGLVSPPSAETLPLFAALTETCRQLSDGNELNIAEQILWAYLPKVELFARLSSGSQKDAAHIVSQGYLLAASLAGHRDDLLDRLRYSEQAFRFGELAGDLNLQVVAMRQTAISFDYLGYPDHVLHTYKQVLPRLHDVSPLLQACIYADLAGTYTQLNQAKEAKRFLNLAYEHFPAPQENERDFLSTICRYATLILCEGLYHLNVDQPHEAERVFAQIDGICPKVPLPERIRLDLLNCQAETFWVLRDLEQACTYLETAIQAAIALGSKRRLQESFTLFQDMQRTWRKESSLVKLQNLFSQHLVKNSQ